MVPSRAAARVIKPSRDVDQFEGEIAAMETELEIDGGQDIWTSSGEDRVWRRARWHEANSFDPKWCRMISKQTMFEVEANQDHRGRVRPQRRELHHCG